MEGGPKRARVSVGPLPPWLDAAQLCGAAPESVEPSEDGSRRVHFVMPISQAAELAARLRGLGFAGVPLDVQVRPGLRRDEVRAGRLAEARARRETTPGFSDSRARAEGEGRYSLTPEPLALAMARGFAGKSVVDACAGSGGNALGFARAGAQVTAIEPEPERRAELLHNARVYGVAEQLKIVAGDARQIVPTLQADLLFVDPPWGEQYDKRATSLAGLPLLSEILACDTARYGEIWLKLPPSFATTELPAFAVEVWFGQASGDRQRVKFLLLRGRADAR